MKRWSLLIVAALFFTSCEKVIDVDLNSAAPKYVIEAVLTDQPGSAKVMLTQTKDFDQDNFFPEVTGATITIAEQGGSTYPLTETASGVYQNSTLTGRSGKTYTMTVRVGSQVFTATSTMPQRVDLDTIYITDELLFTDTRKTVNVEYLDPPGRGNAYRFVQYVNEKKQHQVYVITDDYTDGNWINNKLFYFVDDESDPMNIKSGDTVRIEMICIDQPVYKYWYSLSRSALGSSGQATPANPVSNIQGDALGYFSAHTSQTKSVIVP